MNCLYDDLLFPGLGTHLSAHDNKFYTEIIIFKQILRNLKWSNINCFVFVFVSFTDAEELQWKKYEECKQKIMKNKININ